MTERKSTIINWKSLRFLGDKGVIKGYASVFNNRDLDGDIILPGAFKNTLSKNKEVRLLWQHNANIPIGVLNKLSEDTKGLKMTAQLQLAIIDAQKAYEMVKQNMIKGLSIGFSIIDSFFSKDTRYIKSVNLHEISLVTFPANRLACVDSVKAL